MKSISVISADCLTDADLIRWKEVLSKNPSLDSPYFQPEFTMAVAKVRKDVEVGVLSNNGVICGYFPYQRGRFNMGLPVSGRLSDFHGLITEPGETFALEEVVKQCGLRSFDFDHLVVGETSLRSPQFQVCGSPYISMPNGFDDYLATQKIYSKHFSQYLRKRNKLEREQGRIVIEFDSRSEDDFERLIQWKVSQYKRTGAFNPFRFQWTLDLLKRIWLMQSDSFRGVLSTIRIGKELVGVHFGMISYGTLHYWFPAYNPDYHKYSPGNILLLEIASEGGKQGVCKIDLGKGTESYKLSFGSAQSFVAEGGIRLPSLRNHFTDRYLAAKEWIKSSPLNSPARATAGLLRPLREWLAFR